MRSVHRVELCWKKKKKLHAVSPIPISTLTHALFITMHISKPCPQAMARDATTLLSGLSQQCISYTQQICPRPCYCFNKRIAKGAKYL